MVGLHVDLEAKIAVTTGLASPNPPVLARDLSQHDLYMVARYTERLEIVRELAGTSEAAE